MSSKSYLAVLTLKEATGSEITLKRGVVDSSQFWSLDSSGAHTGANAKRNFQSRCNTSRGSR